jgi:hypothetical protein
MSVCDPAMRYTPEALRSATPRSSIQRYDPSLCRKRYSAS